MPVPSHIAMVMDGNGRWAQSRGQPRHTGHKAGIEPVRLCVRSCAELGISALTLFAFSSENFQRPQEEVSRLMELFMQALQDEIAELQQNKVRLRFIGNRKALSVRLQSRMAETEAQTAANTGLQLVIAVGYGGRWDIVEAARALARRCQTGAINAGDIDESMLQSQLCLAGLPEPDLFIRTGGERRISNFLLWQLAYTELYFTDVLWPDFTRAEFDRALVYFAGRERRFGKTGVQERTD